MPDCRTGAALLEAARTFRPRILAQRDHIEAARRIPEDLARDLAHAGFFRIHLPEVYGGLDLTPMQAMEGFEELAQADASVAWCVWNGNTHWTAAQLSSETARTIHADPDVVTANSTRASGQAHVVDEEALTADEPLVLLAQHPPETVGHGCSAAHRMDRTMFS